MGHSTQEAVKTLHAKGELTVSAASDVMREIMAGEATQAQMAAFLALLQLDQCTPAIIHALADVMRASAAKVEVPRSDASLVVDIVGTGGDGQNTFNISTTAGLVAAGAGARVVKHGNRAATSTSGAADILESLGARLDTPPDEVAAVLEAGNFVFLFARSYHAGMRHVGPVRAELGIRTVFNVLGPLTNPIRPDCMVCGVYAPSLGRMFAEVFKLLGMRRALVVHGCEVLDELSIAGPSKVWELRADGEIAEYETSPADFGVQSFPLSEVASGSPSENAAELREILAGGGRVAVREMVLMNAGAVMYVTGKAAGFKEGVELARAALSDGRAVATLEAYVSASTLSKRQK